MPYTMDNMPESMKGAPKHAMETFIAAFNAAFEKSHVEGAAMAIAMSAVHKAGYKKDEKGNWSEIRNPNSEIRNHTEWIPIFKSGLHRDSNDVEKLWVDAELDAIVAKYNPAEHEAPVVIGHPESNAPAWGWTESLKREGSILYAKFKNLVPEFVEMVRRGFYKKRSISLYPDMTLRHVGFLGAVPPAVKGLPDAAFNDDTACIYIEFGDIGSVTPKSEIPFNLSLKAGVVTIGKEAKGMKWFEWLKGKASAEGVTIEDAPANFSAPNPPPVPPPAGDIEAEVAKRVKAKELAFAETQKTLDAEKARLKAESEKLAAEKVAKTKAEIADFCEGLCKEGKLTPAMTKYGIGMQNFLERLSTIETPIEFADGDTKKTQTAFEFMKGFLSAFNKQIEFGEFAPNSKDIGRGSAGEKLAAFTKQKMKDNQKLNYSQAFSEAQRENPELANEYAAEIGK